MKAGAGTNGTKLAGAASPVLFAGPPSSLSGRITLKDAVAEGVVHRPLLKARLQTRGHAAKGASAEIAMSLDPVSAQSVGSRIVPMSLVLDPFTPPGTYEGQLEFAGELLEVLIHVQEEWDFTMEPDEIVITNHPGEKTERQVVFTNEGNMPLNLKSLGAVALSEDRAHFRALRAALSDVGGDLKSIDEFAAAFAKHFGEVFEKHSLKIQNEKVTIAPGETRVVDFKITVPEKLAARTRYTGAAPIVTDDLSFIVVPD